MEKRKPLRGKVKCRKSYYSTNSEVYPYLHLYNKGKKESDKYGY